MKKEVLVWALAIVLVIAAIFVTKNYRLSTAGQSNTGTSIPAEVQSALSQEGASSAKSNERSRAPDFTRKDLNGNSVSPESLKGKVVYLNFWGTWCYWCQKEMPDLEKVYKAYKDKDVAFLAVSVGDTEQQVKDYAGQYGLTMPIALDPEQAVSNAYVVRGYPTSVFLDKNGNIAQKKEGLMEEAEMKSVLDQLLAEK